jgi:hypothetical protein
VDWVAAANQVVNSDAAKYSLMALWFGAVATVGYRLIKTGRSAKRPQYQKPAPPKDNGARRHSQ